MITASPLVAVETAAAKDELWRPPALFLHDWGSGGCTLRTSWTTMVEETHAGGEARTGLAPKPSRSIEVHYVAWGAAEMALLRSCLQRWTLARTLVPLFCDATPLTAPAAGGATTVLCATACRRFFVGGRVALWPAADTTLATSFELATLAGVADGTLTLSGGLTANHTASTMIAPVIEADLVGEVAATYITDDKIEARLTFRETMGVMTLDPIVAAGTLPAGAGELDGVPLLDLPAQWAQGTLSGGARRLLDTARVGLVNYAEVHGTRFNATQDLEVLPMDRTAAWAASTLFDSRGGRRLAFVAVNLTSDFTWAGTAPQGGESQLNFVARGPLLDWAWRTHVGLELADGTLVARQIGSVSRVNGVDQVTLTAALPTLPTPAIRAGAGFLARFASDEIAEVWRTDTILAARLPAIESLAETPVTLAGMPATAPVGGTRRRSNPAGSGGGNTDPCSAGSCTRILIGFGDFAGMSLDETGEVIILGEVSFNATHWMELFCVEGVLTCSNGTIARQASGKWHIEYESGGGGGDTCTFESVAATSETVPMGLDAWRPLAIASNMGAQLLVGMDCVITQEAENVHEVTITGLDAVRKLNAYDDEPAHYPTNWNWVIYGFDNEFGGISWAIWPDGSGQGAISYLADGKYHDMYGFEFYQQYGLCFLAIDSADYVRINPTSGVYGPMTINAGHVNRAPRRIVISTDGGGITSMAAALPAAPCDNCAPLDPVTVFGSLPYVQSILGGA